MKFPVLLLVLMVGLSGCATASDEPASAEKKPSLFSRLLHPFRKTSKTDHSSVAKGSWRRLTLTMTVDPMQVKLSENRQLKVTLELTNHSSRFVQLEFPTTQRIEVVVRTPLHKLVEQWSEDHAFSSEPGIVSINPGERLVYTAMVATRDMNPGETYYIEGFFPSYEGLRVQKSVVPEK